MQKNLSQGAIGRVLLDHNTALYFLDKFVHKPFNGLIHKSWIETSAHDIRRSVQQSDFEPALRFLFRIRRKF